MLEAIQKKVEDLRIKVYSGQSTDATDDALYEIEQMLFKAMDELAIKRLQHELKAADAAQELYTNDEMSQDDKLQWQYYEGRITLLQEVLLDYIPELSAGI